MTSTPAAAAHATNYTAITITLGIIFIIGVIAVVVASYYRLQRHRADVVAMASYRKLAEDAVANQQELRGQVARPGIMAQVRVRWRDPATWRDIAYLLGLWLPLYALDLIVLTVWLTLLAGVTLPVWYWAPRGNAGVGYVNGTQAHGVALGYFPHGPHGHGAVGLYVDTLPKALLAAAGFLVLFLLFNYVIVAMARAHARIARALLRPPADPLAVAREVLAGPLPLGPLKTQSCNGPPPASHPM